MSFKVFLFSLVLFFSQVEEINAIVSKAFKVAYASIRSKRQFVRLVNELNKEQEEYQTQVQKYIDAKEDQRVSPEELAEKQPLISPDRVRGVGVGQSRVWVRNIINHISYRTLTCIHSLFDCKQFGLVHSEWGRSEGYCSATVLVCLPTSAYLHYILSMFH